MLRLRQNFIKNIESIEFVARKKPGLSLYNIGIIMFFADREHFLDFGRSISGDAYIAMKYGPYPRVILGLMNGNFNYSDDIFRLFNDRIELRIDNNKKRLFSKSEIKPTSLSDSDKKYLSLSVDKYVAMNSSGLQALLVDDVTYRDALLRHGDGNELNIELWLKELDDENISKLQLLEREKCAV